MSKLVVGQPKFTILVANLISGDPSKGAVGNPTILRTGFTQQLFTEISRPDGGEERVTDPRTPGLHTHQGLVKYAGSDPVPVGASGTITVTNADYSAQATLYIGDYTITSGDDYNVTTGTAFVNENITNTAPNGILTVWKTPVAGGGQGALNLPAHIPIVAGTVTLSWTSGGVAKTQTDNGVGGFIGAGNPAGSSITYSTGALQLDTTGFPPDVATTISISYTAITTTQTAANLSAAINALAGYSAVVAGSVVTVTGLYGPGGNTQRFSDEYTGTVQNFLLSPATGFFSGAYPLIGPPTIL